jgi:hypothetical protein
MLAHGGHSELHLLPEELMRCFAIGQFADVSVPKSDAFAALCSNYNVTSINHTIAFSSMVEPLTTFLLRAVDAHKQNDSTGAVSSYL